MNFAALLFCAGVKRTGYFFSAIKSSGANNDECVWTSPSPSRTLALLVVASSEYLRSHCAECRFPSLALSFQEAMEQTWALLDWSSAPPTQPIISKFDGLQVVLKIGGTTPVPAFLAVDEVEVQQEPGPVHIVASTVGEVSLARARSYERVRLRWRRGGKSGPWSDWKDVVSRLRWSLLRTEKGNSSSIEALNFGCFVCVQTCPWMAGGSAVATSRF